MDGSHRAVG